MRRKQSPERLPLRTRLGAWRRPKVWIPVAAIVAVAAVGSSVMVLSSGDDNGLVVAGETVDRGLLNQMVDQTMEMMEGAPEVAVPMDQQRESIQDMMAIQLSTLALLRREAREQNITVTDNDLRRAMQSAPHDDEVDLSDPQLRSTLEFSVLRAKFRQMLMRENPPDLSDKAVKHWYEEHKDEFYTPRRRGVFVLETASKQKALAALRDVRANEPLSNLFEKYGDPTSATYSSGGTLVVEDGTLAPALVSKLMSAPTRTWVGPLKSGSRWMLAYMSEPMERETTLGLADSKATVKEAIANRHVDGLWDDFVAELRRKYAGETKDPEGLLPAEISAQPGSAGPSAPLPPIDEVPPAAPSPNAPPMPTSTEPVELTPPPPAP